MTKIVAVLLCVGILGAPTSARADETYRLCGPESTGFIRIGKHTTCIGGHDTQQGGSPANTTPLPGSVPAELVDLAVKQSERRAALVAGDCGEEPDHRDYGLKSPFPGLRNASGEYVNPTGQSLYSRDLRQYNECANRVMTTKYKNESEKSKAEFRRKAEETGFAK